MILLAPLSGRRNRLDLGGARRGHGHEYAWLTRRSGGRAGWGLRIGFEHGAYYLGCCWFLMGLLFFGGIMNLFWIAGLAGFILLEKTIPLGHWFGRLGGIAAVGCGVLMLVRAAGSS